MTYKKELALGLGWLLLSLFFFTVHLRSSQETMAAEIAPDILRFRVLANSNSRQDQQLKLEIRDAILNYMQELPAESQDKETFSAMLSDHLPEIEALAGQMIADAGYSYSAAAELVNCHFPPKTYGSLLFPEGNYDALRITLGKGRGLNWWCVLYPHLCFTDAACSSISPESEAQMKTVFDAAADSKQGSTENHTTANGQNKGGRLLIEDRRPEIRFLIQDLTDLLPPSHNPPSPGRNQALHSRSSSSAKDTLQLTADTAEH